MNVEKCFVMRGGPDRLQCDRTLRLKIFNCNLYRFEKAYIVFVCQPVFFSGSKENVCSSSKP